MESADKRHMIMQTAEKLFKSRRIHEITLDEVAQKAHVGKGTIYLHFENKDDLFFQVATSGFDELCELIRAQVSQEDRFEGQLLQMCRAISAFFGKRREMFQMMMAEDARMNGCQRSLRERWIERRKKLREAVALVIGRGVAEGRIRSDIPPETLAVLLLGLMRTRAHELDNQPDGEQLIIELSLIIDLFMNGAGRGKRA
jgi:TetR/AcrR family fatty acid metabolism transcriptional regulator